MPFRHITPRVGLTTLAAVSVPAAVTLTNPTFLGRLVDADFMPHGYCYAWDPALIVLHVGSDVLIAAAYFAIAVSLAVLYFKTRDTLPYSSVLPIFGTFILACGMAHAMAVVVLWEPLYWLHGDIKLLTAVTSVAAALALPPLIPVVERTIRDARRQRRADRIFATAVETRLDGVVILSARRGADGAIEGFHLQFANQPARDMLGLDPGADTPSEADLRRAFSRMPGSEVLIATAEGDDALRTTLSYVTAAQQTRWLEQLWAKFEDGLLLSLRDVTDTKTIEAQAIAKGHADPLTGLPNRAQLEQRIDDAIEYARAVQTSVGLIFVDIDDFKGVNDRHGHLVGDAVLRETARRLSRAMRESDVVFRYAGDEFVILAYGLQSDPELAGLARRLMAQFAEPIDAEDGLRLSICVSAGGAVAASEATDVTTLIRQADQAMYRAKRSGEGRTRFQLFDSASERSVA